MTETGSRKEAWQRVLEAYARYHEAAWFLPLEAPELHIYRQEYIAALARHLAMLQRELGRVPDPS